MKQIWMESCKIQHKTDVFWQRLKTIEGHRGLGAGSALYFNASTSPWVCSWGILTVYSLGDAVRKRASIWLHRSPARWWNPGHRGLTCRGAAHGARTAATPCDGGKKACKMKNPHWAALYPAVTTAIYLANLITAFRIPRSDSKMFCSLRLWYWFGSMPKGHHGCLLGIYHISQLEVSAKGVSLFGSPKMATWLLPKTKQPSFFAQVFHIAPSWCQSVQPCSNLLMDPMGPTAARGSEIIWYRGPAFRPTKFGQDDCIIRWSEDQILVVGSHRMPAHQQQAS